MRTIDADALSANLDGMMAVSPTGYIHGDTVADMIGDAPTIEPDLLVDADKLKRCRFEYINACKIVARPTPDTSKNDIYDANAVIKALHPIFGDEEF